MMFHITAHLLGEPSGTDLRDTCKTRFAAMARAKVLATEALPQGGTITCERHRYEGHLLDRPEPWIEVDDYRVYDGAGYLFSQVTVAPGKADTLPSRPSPYRPRVDPGCAITPLRRCGMFVCDNGCKDFEVIVTTPEALEYAEMGVLVDRAGESCTCFEDGVAGVPAHVAESALEESEGVCTACGGTVEWLASRYPVRYNAV